ncbi:MAG: DUF5107 domain-containing protein [Pirellulaceae bacterium]|nr:DUF5107 domain-containing protein [Pirellulaceae bacterium]
MMDPGSQVRVWRERVTIPTYGTGQPDRNPMFLDKRVYQGSSGVVYPWPVIDRILDERRDQAYDAVFLENEFLRLMILPQLGGRLQMALDKTNQYHFIYYNRVIKPALVGLAGPWISGGLEFNWPQHHRPSTFAPVDCGLVSHSDGSCTVWCSEIDRMQGTKGMHGFTLHPGKAYLEIQVRLYNRTALPQTFLWWANPAVHVDEHHQSVFPPDVRAVMDHGKRDVSTFPLATGTYYKVNYAPGTDISRYRNIPVPTSYMAYRSSFDFVGSYDHGRQAGLLHIAPHHIAPGKKQWTWGHGDFGQAWERELTDDDGPYIELMCGAYTDNQPDFSWLMPGEEKSFSQFFLPYKGVGVVQNATVDAAVSLALEGDAGVLRAYTSSVQPGCRAVIQSGDQTLFAATFDGTPTTSFEARVAPAWADGSRDVEVVIEDRTGRPLVTWRPRACPDHGMPEPAQALPAPVELDSVEALYLAGLHLEQYRHATRRPEDYYREGLRRDPGDARCCNALGRWLYRHGCADEAEQLFRAAIARLTRHNPNPCDGEPYYNLGRTLLWQSRWNEAYEAFYKATWNAAWQDAAFFQLARIAVRRGDLADAARHLASCLRLNAAHHQAVHLQVVLLVLQQRTEEALHATRDELARDPFNTGVLFEAMALDGRWRQTFVDRMRRASHNYVELALDYAEAGLWERAAAVLNEYLQQVSDEGDSPLVHYFLASYYRQLGQVDQAETAARRAAAHAPDYCFPHRTAEIPVLAEAARCAPQDARAPYYLGNLWYHHRQYELAIRCWEQACSADPDFATVWRNLGLAYYNVRRDGSRAWEAFARAFALNPDDARVLYELDQLAKRLGHPASERLARFDAHDDLVRRRDDLYLERVVLLNQLGQHEPALDSILQRRFHPWEGGEGKVPAQFVLALTQLARLEIERGRYAEALAWLDRTTTWPASLGEGRLPGMQENHVQYWRGCAQRGLGDSAAARASFEQASQGLSEPKSVMFYNDQPPDMIFYQGLALHALGRQDAAKERFALLLDYGRAHLDDHAEIDYFAVSLPDFLVFDDDLTTRHETHCRYLMALGLAGLRQSAAAQEQFQRVLALDANHLGALVHQSFADG